jgi:hypothetical protein
MPKSVNKFIYMDHVYASVCMYVCTISLRFGLFNIYLISMVYAVERKYMIITGNCICMYVYIYINECLFCILTIIIIIQLILLMYSLTTLVICTCHRLF